MILIFTFFCQDFLSSEMLYLENVNRNRKQPVDLRTLQSLLHSIDRTILY